MSGERERRDADLARELDAHLELETEDRQEMGISCEEARRAARLDLGNSTSVREAVYEMGLGYRISRWWADLRYAGRALVRNPGFAAVAILSLGLGIGAATAIFTVADQALLRLLPVKDPHRLASLRWEGDFIGGATKGWRESFSYPVFRELEAARPDALSGIAARYQSEATLDGAGRASRVRVETVSGSYFEVLGVTAALGRTLLPEDDQERDGEPWAVLSYACWRDRFAADPGVVGATIRIDSYPFTVIGVAQPGFKGFEGLRPADVFVPLQMQAAVTPSWDHRDRRDSIWLNVFGRLAPGVTYAQAAASLQLPYAAALRRDLEAHPRGQEQEERYVKNTLVLSDASQGFGQVREFLAQPLHILIAMVALLMLITCVNVANLLIVRSAKRAREIALRASLGASRGAMVRLVLAECVVLAAAGAALGMVLALVGAAALARMVPTELLGIALDTAPDWRVVGFAGAMALATVLLFGLAPALQAARSSSAAALKDSAASVGSNRAQRRLRHTLVATQVGLSLALLAIAGLFGKSLEKVFAAQPGLDVESLLAFFVNPSEHGYDVERARRLALEIESRLKLQPGVEAVGVTTDPLLAGANGQNTIAVEGYQAGEDENMQAGANYALPGFFGAVGVPLLAGRDFSERDALGAPRVVVVNETFANRFLGSASDAVGRRVGSALGKGELPYELVGVVGDHKSQNLREKPIPRTYFPLLQREKLDLMTVYVRAKGDPAALAGAAQRAVAEVDPALAVFGLKTLERQAEETHYVERLFARLSAAFALLATLIAVVGVYGVAAFSVARRTREIGVRVALGAAPGGVFTMVLRETLSLAAAGMAIGIPLAFGVAKLVEAHLYGVGAADPMVAFGASAALLAACAVAALVPARRATRISPMSALRQD
ncbi:MAG: ABC transporter permease [Acidobacteria bacterium]|nr:ABC transporter permease [Acidobacteriota bacterium]